MIEVTRDGATVTIRLNRPPANAFTAEGLAALTETVDGLNRDANVRAIVITGTGPKNRILQEDVQKFVKQQLKSKL